MTSAAFGSTPGEGVLRTHHQDGVLVVDGWFYQAPTTYSADVPLTAGLHTVVVEYFEFSGGAVASFKESEVGDG